MFPVHAVREFMLEAPRPSDLLQCLPFGLVIKTLSFSFFGSEIFSFVDLSIGVYSYAEGVCSLFIKTFKNLTCLN